MSKYVDEALTSKIKKIKEKRNVFELGQVIKVNDYIVEARGLENVKFFEQVDIAGKAVGYINGILEDSVIIAVVKEKESILIGDSITSTGEIFKTYFTSHAAGRIIDIFGEDKLTGKMFDKLKKIDIENPTIPIMDRTAVNRPMLTGISGIDLIYPIGRGQRQLIIGDKKIGKTQICLDAIVNQKSQKVICFYIAIGKTKKELKTIYNELLKKGALSYTVIVAASNDEKPPVLSLTPYAGLSMAEIYLKKGMDVLVVIDDLKRHADAYREISLLAGKAPGRDAYPSDIFYTHSRLLEKGCQHKNGGSITILPIIETKGGDITDYISTNVISITDGQIVLSSKSFLKGEKPSISYGLSVSRLGGAVQTKEMSKLGSKLRRELLSYIETRDVYELANFDEMSPELQKKMLDGKKIISELNQQKFSPLSMKEMLNKFSFITEKTTLKRGKIVEENNEH